MGLFFVALGPNVVVEWLTFLLHIWEVLARRLAILTEVFCGFFSVPPKQMPG
jgi:hypothetical protein